MERTKNRIVILLILSLWWLPSSGSVREVIYKAYLSNEMGRWRMVVDSMQQLNLKSDSTLAELINYQYGYIGWCIGNNRKKVASEYLKRAENNLDLLEKRQYQPSLIYAYRAAFYGYHIGINKFSAPLYGSKCREAAHRAIEIAPEEPLGYIQMGNVLMHMPEWVGGSKKGALNNFLKAKLLMERQKDRLKHDWNYLSLRVQIAQVYQVLKDFPNSQSYYENLLLSEPGFSWVRDELYPNILKETKK